MSRLLGCVSAGSWAIGSNNLREVDKNNSDCEAIVERCGPAFFAEVENTKCVSSSYLLLMSSSCLLLPYAGSF